MTTQECETRDKRIIDSIGEVFSVHPQLHAYAGSLRIAIEHSVIVLRGDLPTRELQAELIPAVRQAGVLNQVCNCVRVSSAARRAG